MAVDVSPALANVVGVALAIAAVGTAGLAVLVGIAAYGVIKQMLGAGGGGAFTPRQVAAIKAKQAAAAGGAGVGGASEALEFDLAAAGVSSPGDRYSGMSKDELYALRDDLSDSLQDRSTTMVIDGKEEQVFDPHDSEARLYREEINEVDNELERRSRG